MARFQPFNDLPASQYELLKTDIDARGIVNPILVDENDITIDGHQRRKVAADLAIDCPKIVVPGLTDDEKMSLAFALNMFRRHLVGVERSRALQQMAGLGMSIRRIAGATGIPRSTVHDALTGVRDRTPEAPVPDGTPEPEPEPGVDSETGEITTATSGSGDSEMSPNGDTEAEGPGDDEQRTADAPAPSPAPNPAPRVKGKDGKSYPAHQPKPEPTPEQQAAEDREGQLRRAALRLEQFVNGWIEFESFASNPDRGDILDRLIPRDRAVILDIEARFMIGASQ